MSLAKALDRLIIMLQEHPAYAYNLLMLYDALLKVLDELLPILGEKPQAIAPPPGEDLVELLDKVDRHLRVFVLKHSRLTHSLETSFTTRAYRFTSTPGQNVKAPQDLIALRLKVLDYEQRNRMESNAINISGVDMKNKRKNMIRKKKKTIKARAADEHNRELFDYSEYMHLLYVLGKDVTYLEDALCATWAHVYTLWDIWEPAPGRMTVAQFVAQFPPLYRTLRVMGFSAEELQTWPQYEMRPDSVLVTSSDPSAQLQAKYIDNSLNLADVIYLLQFIRMQQWYINFQSEPWRVGFRALVGCASRFIIYSDKPRRYNASPGVVLELDAQPESLEEFGLHWSERYVERPDPDMCLSLYGERIIEATIVDAWRHTHIHMDFPERSRIPQDARLEGVQRFIATVAGDVKLSEQQQIAFRNSIMEFYIAFGFQKFCQEANINSRGVANLVGDNTSGQVYNEILRRYKRHPLELVRDETLYESIRLFIILFYLGEYLKAKGVPQFCKDYYQLYSTDLKVMLDAPHLQDHPLFVRLGHELCVMEGGIVWSGSPEMLLLKFFTLIHDEDDLISGVNVLNLWELLTGVSVEAQASIVDDAINNNVPKIVFGMIGMGTQ